LTFDQASTLVDVVSGPLWFDGGSTANGLNDLIPEAEAKELGGSLLLVKPENFQMMVTKEGGAFGPPRKKVRGHVGLAGFDYIFSVTDQIIEAEAAQLDENASRSIGEVLLCLSISEVFEKTNACYKLIAGVIERGSALG
jgi:hypothetical protein